MSSSEPPKQVAPSENSSVPLRLESVWQEFGEQFRRRARTRLRQYGLSGQAESMDICNDVMADLTRRGMRDEIAPKEVLGYIMRAIDHQVIDTFRTLARQCRDFRRNEETPVEGVMVPAHAATPSQVALKREVLAKIRSLLPEQDAIAVDMMLENRNWNEIGDQLGVRPDTARMRVRRAIEKVREAIGASADTGMEP